MKDAREKDKSITKDDVEEFFRKNVEVKKKPRGYNSFVAPHNSHTYQIDFFYFGKKDFEQKQEFKGGLVAIDLLSKYAVVIPIKSKKPIPVITATMEALQKWARNLK